MANFWDKLTGKNTENSWNTQKSNIENANNNYNTTASKYTGNAGYNNGLQQQQKGQNATQQNAAQQAQTSARTSGMSKAQQAQMGQNSTANSYANNFNSQQNSAQSQGNNAVSQAQQNVQNVSNLANADLGVQNTQTQNAKNNLNYLTTTAESIGNILQPALATSDERTKDAVDITDKDPTDAISEGSNLGDIKHVDDTKEIDSIKDKLAQNQQETESSDKEEGKETGSTVGKIQGTQIGNAIQPGAGGKIGAAVGGAGGELVGGLISSDERCKDKENLDKEVVDSHKTKAKTISEYLADIDSYIYKYKDSAKEQMPGLTDDRKHVGVMAQDLQKNPQTQGTVVEMPNGTLAVDTKQLSLTNTQNLQDLARRLDAVERRLNDYDTNKVIKEGE